LPGELSPGGYLLLSFGLYLYSHRFSSSVTTRPLYDDHHHHITSERTLSLHLRLSGARNACSRLWGPRNGVPHNVSAGETVKCGGCRKNGVHKYGSYLISNTTLLPMSVITLFPPLKIRWFLPRKVSSLPYEGFQL